MQVSINFVLPDPVQLIVYLVIGLVVALLVAGLARVRSALGFIVTALLATFGAWLFANVLNLTVLGDVSVAGVPLIEALLGALIFALVGALLFARRRRDVVVVDD